MAARSMLRLASMAVLSLTGALMLLTGYLTFATPAAAQFWGGGGDPFGGGGWRPRPQRPIPQQPQQQIRSAASFSSSRLGSNERPGRRARNWATIPRRLPRQAWTRRPPRPSWCWATPWRTGSVTGWKKPTATAPKSASCGRSSQQRPDPGRGAPRLHRLGAAGARPPGLGGPDFVVFTIGLSDRIPIRERGGAAAARQGQQAATPAAAEGQPPTASRTAARRPRPSGPAPCRPLPPARMNSAPSSGSSSTASASTTRSRRSRPRASRSSGSGWRRCAARARATT